MSDSIDPPLRRRLAAEALGTFGLVFAGTAAVVVNDATGALSHVGVALTFGLGCSPSSRPSATCSGRT